MLARSSPLVEKINSVNIGQTYRGGAIDLRDVRLCVWLLRVDIIDCVVSLVVVCVLVTCDANDLRRCDISYSQCCRRGNVVINVRVEVDVG